MDTNDSKTSSAPDVTVRPDTIVHISDIHVGSGYRPELAEDLIEHINDVNPDLVVVSGDLTMRARTQQFEQARDLLRRVKVPLMVIPGNHDVPLYAVWHRAVRPFKNYRHYIADLNCGPIELNHVAFFDMNTVNPWKHQQGKIRKLELMALERWARSLSADKWKFAVVHQHFANVPGHERPGAFSRGKQVLSRMAASGVHGVLHGHVHYRHVASSAEFFPRLNHRLVLVCAGTPTSLRIRGEVATNNYNVLRFYPDHFEVHPCDWKAETEGFAFCGSVSFDRSFYEEPAT